MGTLRHGRAKSHNVTRGLPASPTARQAHLGNFDNDILLHHTLPHSNVRRSSPRRGVALARAPSSVPSTRSGSIRHGPPPGERDAARPHVAIPAGRQSMQCEPRRVSTLLQNGKRSRVVACQRASTLRVQHPIRHGPPGSVTQCDPTWRSLPAAQVCNAKLGVCPRSCKTENVNVRQHTSAHDAHLGIRLPNPV